MKSLFFLALFAGNALAAPECSTSPGSLPRPTFAAGTPDKANPIEHVIVIMQENHSFDNYFGSLSAPQFYGSQVDGLRPGLSNRHRSGKEVPVFKQTNLCVTDLAHDWNSMHNDWNNGAMDGFVRTNDDRGDGTRVMGVYDETDLPFYYALANQFAIGDRYFASTLTQTFPNRFYLLTGTSFGHIQNLLPGSKTSYAQKTLFDLLDEYGITWKYYNDGEGYLKLFQPLYLRSLDKMKTIADYESDLAAGTLPQVAFLDTSAEGEDEHPSADIQIGETWVSQRIRALMASSAWSTSALFLTYDEGGGFYDHVNPPQACAPDSIAPLLMPGSVPGGFDQLGFRVPFVAVSPYARHHFVSHNIYDHSSILKFIETKFNLPALTARDANADGFSDVFDFAHPVFKVAPLPESVPDPVRGCNPPNALKLPASPVSIRSNLNGLCVNHLGTNLTFEICNGSDAQKFSFHADRFHSNQIRGADGICLSADWDHKRIVPVACAEEEDQGFGAWNGNSPGTVEFSGWHGDLCMSAAAAGAPVELTTCFTTESVIDFILN
ncbi:MAG: alkaline phosphatase family protein [Bdellovibrionota bacterium]